MDILQFLADVKNRLLNSHSVPYGKDIYQSFIEATPVGYYQVNKKGETVYVNKAATQMFGVPEDKILGMGWTNYIHKEYKDRAIKKFQTAIKDKVPYDIEGKLTREDGSTCWVLGKAEPYYDENGEYQGHLGTLVDLTEVKELQEQLEDLACYDNTTRLPNRKFFDDTLIKAVTSAERYQEKFALLCIDIDELNKINDSRGHSFGDKLLIKMGERLETILRKHDFIARLGGDEFAIIMKRYESEGNVAALAARVLEKIQEPYTIDGGTAYISGSIGIAIYSGEGCDAEMMKQKADSALFRAKTAGGNNFQFYSQKMQKQIQQQVKIENLLHNAVVKEELYLVYQPQVDSGTRKIAAYEVLLRWNSPQLGQVDPSVFIPIAENSRLVDLIGDWVLETALAQHKKWLDKYKTQGFGDIAMSINISPAQMQKIDIVPKFIAMVNRSAVDPKKVMLEVTETTYIRNPELLQESLTSLKAFGINIGIDDFGTGYSSLNVIEKLPIQFLKIDTGFVRNLFLTKHNIAIIEAVCSLSKSLNFKVIAEGVENEEQAKTLSELGCDVLQGFLFTKPLETDDFEKYFLQNLQ